MKVAIIGSTSALAELVIASLQRKNIGFVSIGRSHSKSANEKIEWSLGTPLKIPDDVIFVFYLVFDHSSIKNKNQYFDRNVLGLVQFLESLTKPEDVILPLSLSARHDSNSRYGKAKWEHSQIATAYSLNTMLVGWSKVTNNGGREVQSTIRMLRKVPLNLLPAKGEQTIHFTEPSDIERALSEIFQGKRNVDATNLNVGNLSELVYGDESKPRLQLGWITLFGIRIAPYLYWFIPSKWVKAFDSARSITIKS